MSDDVLELTITEYESTTEVEFSGDVWELTIETGQRGPAGIGGEEITHGDLPGRNEPNQHSWAAINAGGVPLNELLATLGPATFADFILDADEVDGTGNSFSLLTPTGEASGFTENGTLDAAGFAAFLDSVFPSGATVAVPLGTHSNNYTVTADTLTDPWVTKTSTLVYTEIGSLSVEWLAALTDGSTMRTLYPSPEARRVRLSIPPPLVDSGKWLLTKGDNNSYASCPVPGPLTGLDVRMKVAARMPLPTAGTPGEKKYLEICTIPHPSFLDFDILEIADEYDPETGDIGDYAEFHRGGDPVVEHGEYDDGRIQTADSESRVAVGHAKEIRYTIDPAAGEIAFWKRVLNYGDDVTADGRHWEKTARKTVAPFTMSELIDVGKTLYIGIHDGNLAVGEFEVRDGIDGDLWMRLPFDGTLDDAGNTWTFHGDSKIVDFSLDAEDPHGDRAYAIQRANHTGTQSADTVVDGATNKAYTATEKTKLAGIASSATANSSDATLLDRANHTGTQLASTISDLTALGTALHATASSDTAVTSSTTLTNDTGLSVAITAATWHFRAVLWVTGDSGGDLDTAVTVPTNSAFFVGTRAVTNIASAFPNIPNDNVVTSSGARMTGFGTITSNTTMVTIEGTVIATASGNIQVQHSQRNSNATATTVKAGSHIMAWRG